MKKLALSMTIMLAAGAAGAQTPGSFSGVTTGPAPSRTAPALSARQLDDTFATKADLIDLRAYGAKCDGSTDDTAAATAAFQAAAAAPYGAIIATPQGRCLFHSAMTLTIATAGVEIRGEGPDVSEWVYTQDTDGIDVTFASDGWWTRGFGETGAALRVNGLALVSAAPVGQGTGTALKVIGDSVTGRPSPNTSIEQVAMHGGLTTQGWGNGINVHDVSQLILRDDVWTGLNQSLGGVALEISGVQATNEAVNHIIDNFRCTFGAVCIKIDAGVQGVFVANSNLNNVLGGVDWEIAPGTPEDSLYVSTTNIQASNYGVKTSNVYDVILAGDYFLMGGSETGVSNTSGGLMVVSNSTFRGGYQQETGIFVDRSANTVPAQFGSAITGNVLANLGTAALAFSPTFTGPLAVGSNQFSFDRTIYASKPSLVAMLANEINDGAVLGDPYSPLTIEGIGTIPLGALVDSSIRITPVVSGFSIAEPQFTDGDLLTCSGQLTSGSIAMPLSPSDHQLYTVASQCNVTTMTWNGNGMGFAVNANPASLTAGQPFTDIFSAAGNAWYRWR